MLQITIPERESFDESTGKFIYTKEYTLQLEHSLVSLSRWESKWKKPFLNQKEALNREELIDYIRCMSINNGVPDIAYEAIGPLEMQMILGYIADGHTATTITDRRPRPVKQEIITSELIYYWMIACGIPFECQKWHLNRLLTLIKICNIKQGPEQKMSRQSIYAQNAALNNARRAKLHSRG